jgi:hypothetical protein
MAQRVRITLEQHLAGFVQGETEGPQPTDKMSDKARRDDWLMRHRSILLFLRRIRAGVTLHRGRLLQKGIADQAAVMPDNAAIKGRTGLSFDRLPLASGCATIGNRRWETQNRLLLFGKGRQTCSFEVRALIVDTNGRRPRRPSYGWMFTGRGGFLCPTSIFCYSQTHLSFVFVQLEFHQGVRMRLDWVVEEYCSLFETIVRAFATFNPLR